MTAMPPEAEDSSRRERPRAIDMEIFGHGHALAPGLVSGSPQQDADASDLDELEKSLEWPSRRFASRNSKPAPAAELRPVTPLETLFNDAGSRSARRNRAAD
jgi:hypothetical protein